MDGTTSFYFSPTETSEQFYLPETYFVELLSIENEDFYQAKYNDQYGYVKKTSVKPINGIPQTPYLNNISFRVFVPSGANLRSTPQNLGATNLIYSIPFLETNLLYYGIASGEEVINKKGTNWYFCKYYVNNLSYTGYVYAPLCDCLSPIPTNSEIFEFIEEELTFLDSSISTNTNALDGLSDVAQTIIIIVVSLPCLLFIYLLFKPTKLAEASETNRNNKSTSHKRKKKISRLKNSDYFEFDDDFN